MILGIRSCVSGFCLLCMHSLACSCRATCVETALIEIRLPGCEVIGASVKASINVCTVSIEGGLNFSAMQGAVINNPAMGRIPAVHAECGKFAG